MSGLARTEFVLGVGGIKNSFGGWPRGRVVKFAHSALVAQGFTGLDPWCGHGIPHQAMLRRRPRQYNQRLSQVESTTVYWEGSGEKKKKKKDWQQLLAQVPIFKKKKRRKKNMMLM